MTAELRGHAADKTRRPHEAERVGPAQAEPQEAVEPGAVVDVPMGDEDVGDGQNLVRGESGQVAQMEEQRAPAEAEVEDQARILEGTIDEPGPDELAHWNGRGAAPLPLNRGASAASGEAGPCRPF